MNFLIFTKKKVLIVICIFLLLIALSYILKPLGQLANIDGYWGVNTTKFLHLSLYSWIDVLNGGYETVASLIFGYLLSFGLERIGLSFSNVGIILLVLFGTWITAYHLVIHLLDVKTTKEKILILILSLVVVFNEVTKAAILGNVTVLWSTLLSYLGVLFFFKYYHHGKFVYCFLSVIFFSVALLDLHNVILYIGFISMYAVIEFILTYIKTKKFSSTIWKLCIFLGTFLVTNIYWIVPNIYSLITKTGPFEFYISGKDTTDNTLSTYNLYNILGLNLMLTNINSYQRTLAHALDVIASYSFLGMAVSALFLYRKKLSAKLLYLLIIWVILFSFSLGPKNPLKLFDIAWTYIPGFILFRNFYKFHRLLLLIYLIFSSATVIALIRKGFFKQILYVIFVVIYLKSVLFMSTWYLFSPVKIPEYYPKMASILNNDKLDAHTAVLPAIYDHIYLDLPTTTRFNIQEPLRYYVNKPLYVNNATDNVSLNEEIQFKTGEALSDGNYPLFLYLLKRRNIRYVVIRTDLSSRHQEYGYHKEFDDELLLRKARKSPGLTELKTIGKLHLFRVDSEQYLPHFYIPQDVRITSSTKKPDYNKLILTQQPDAIFYKTRANSRMLDSIAKFRPSENVSIEYAKINPTKYIVRIKNATDTLPVVFTENYSSNWRMSVVDKLHNNSVNNKEFVSEQFGKTVQNDNLMNSTYSESASYDLPTDKHQKVDMLMNGWIFPVKDICSSKDLCTKNADGTYNVDVVVHYASQEVYMKALMINGVLLLGVILLVIISLFKKNK